MNFSVYASNRLLLNPRISEDEKTVLIELKNEFERIVATTGHFLIASSGSSQQANASAKLIALPIEKILNSARRFNQYYKAGEDAHWGLVLPEYHVAGLSIWARAFLAGSEVFVQDWQTSNLFTWIVKNNIKFISMVPAQIFDLVKENIRAPNDVVKIFVGAGALAEELHERALALGWPIVETYGMTETASMVAVKEGEFFKILPGVEIKTDCDILSIKCNSLLAASIQKIDNQIVISKVPENSWYQSQDRAKLINIEQSVHLKFLGRNSDYIKVLGEGVSLGELRNQFNKSVILGDLDMAKFELVALEDVRAGFKLFLAVEESVSGILADKLIEVFNLSCRPYEKILKCVVVGRIPRTDMGKLKTEELKRIVLAEITKGMHG